MTRENSDSPERKKNPRLRGLKKVGAASAIVGAAAAGVGGITASFSQSNAYAVDTIAAASAGAQIPPLAQQLDTQLKSVVDVSGRMAPGSNDPSNPSVQAESAIQNAAAAGDALVRDSTANQLTNTFNDATVVGDFANQANQDLGKSRAKGQQGTSATQSNSQRSPLAVLQAVSIDAG
jgi:hypothetical protein